MIYLDFSGFLVVMTKEPLNLIEPDGLNQKLGKAAPGDAAFVIAQI
jgi:hypothetical protein